MNYTPCMIISMLCINYYPKRILKYNYYILRLSNLSNLLLYKLSSRRIISFNCLRLVSSLLNTFCKLMFHLLYIIINMIYYSLDIYLPYLKSILHHTLYKLMHYIECIRLEQNQDCISCIFYHLIYISH
jgi:hypothetical protein